jgi:hypothetical protein
MAHQNVPKVFTLMGFYLTTQKIPFRWLATKVIRVARWYIFKPKIQIGYLSEGIAMEEVGKFYLILLFYSILQSFCIFYGDLVYFCQFGIFSPVLVFCAKKNRVTLVR